MRDKKLGDNLRATHLERLKALTHFGAAKVTQQSLTRNHKQKLGQ